MHSTSNLDSYSFLSRLQELYIDLHHEFDFRWPIRRDHPKRLLIQDRGYQLNPQDCLIELNGLVRPHHRFF